MKYQLELTLTALKMLGEITDQRIREKIAQRIDRFAEEPEKQGKPLAGELAGCRSVKAVGQRYRILCTIKQEAATVVVLAVGLRRQGDRSDVYALAKKLLRLGLLDV